MPEEPFDRDELRVCLVIAFCLCGTGLEIIYRFMG